MKKLLFTLLALGLFLTAPAGNFEKFYRQSLHAEGLLYFVLPQQMPCQQAGAGIPCEPLSYDYTCLDGRDSVSLLVTITSGEVFRPDSLHIAAGLSDGTYPVEVIYYKPVKKRWECRTRIVMPYRQWEEMYRPEQPFRLEFSSTPGARACFSDSPRKWPKIRADFLRLQEMIKLNK
jgi:hypothetical protein